MEIRDLVDKEFTLETLENLFPDFVSNNISVVERVNDKVELGVINHSIINDYIPNDWIDISDTPNGCIQMIATDIGDGEVTIRILTTSGDYKVDWGDGVVEQYSSGAQNVYHKYVKGSGIPCKLGYTMFKILISPVTGGSSIKTCTTEMDTLLDYISIVDINVNSKLESLSLTKHQNLVRISFKTNIMEGPSNGSTGVLSIDNAFNLKEINATDGVLTLKGLSTNSFSISRNIALVKLPQIKYEISSGSMISPNLLNLKKYEILSLVNTTINPVGIMGEECLIDDIYVTGLAKVYADNVKKVTFSNSTLKGIDFELQGHLVEEISLSNTTLEYISLPDLPDSNDIKRLTTKITFKGNCVMLNNSTGNPEITLHDSIISAEELNTIFAQLPIPSTGRHVISIIGCIGASTCDVTIANNRNWDVITA